MSDFVKTVKRLCPRFWWCCYSLRCVFKTISNHRDIWTRQIQCTSAPDVGMFFSWHALEAMCTSTISILLKSRHLPIEWLPSWQLFVTANFILTAP